MRYLILKDKDISQDEFKSWRDESRAFWKEHTLLNPLYTVVDYDLSYYPTEFDADGDVRPKHTWLQALTDDVKGEHGKYGVDHVVILIHEDNWRSSGPLFDELQATRPNPKEKGIWGTNYSNIYHGYHVHYCRWDKDNLANVFGTLYHEAFHSFDALIATELGIDIAPILKVNDIDPDIVHGGHPDWKYIRHKENTKALPIMAPYLRRAYGKRIERHEKRRQQMYTTIGDLVSEIGHLIRELFNRKNGVSRWS